jgi:hypothetical protein
MTKAFTYSEKAIGAFQIIWGVFSLFVSIWGLINIYDMGVKYLNVTWTKISILKVIRKYHFGLLLAILPIISGILLMLNKKMGWGLTIIISFVTAMTSILMLITDYHKPRKSASYPPHLILIDAILIAVFFFISFFLLLKPFRVKYNPKKKTWWILSITTGVMLYDEIICNIIL